ncbi:pyridoxal phosphate-dependent decarboxylase family protein [Actinoplanes sp. RD1]|uniref:pyridoxal phosphate-dependent decarboxylase family protein n=1 Tax=Actinoplanes sp. RD1 TaxID=3064538 RepID=UPI0027405EA5|nr:aminotransferase class V-fold PLP-dependent enzyme [Actinoplanes sp. RD1]
MTGIPADQVLAELRALREGDLPTHGGRLFAYVYDPAVPGLDELAREAYGISSAVNGLDPTAFPSLLAMENALVATAGRLLGAGPGTAAPDMVGSVTSGGTESILLAVKAARDAGATEQPRMVVPYSAHAAFAKAAQYFGVALDVVPTGSGLRADVAATARRIGPDTVLVVGSAPSYAHGVIDPIAELAAVAAERGVRCHVDACFGGWVLPYLRRLGADIPPFAFDVPGVTSVSVDLHKYAYTPKGVSLLLHRDAGLRASQYFAYSDWPGYPMVNPVLTSTRPGGPIAAALATVRHLGDDGYLRLAGRTREAVAILAAAVEATEGVRLIAPAETTVVCLTCTPGYDVFVLADELAARGWHTQVQLGYDDVLPTLHLTVTAAVRDAVDAFAADLAAAVTAAEGTRPAQVPVLSPQDVTPELIQQLAATTGLSSGRMSEVHRLLDAASPALREALLTGFLSQLQSPAW